MSNWVYMQGCKKCKKMYIQSYDTKGHLCGKCKEIEVKKEEDEKNSKQIKEAWGKSNPIEDLEL